MTTRPVAFRLRVKTPLLLENDALVFHESTPRVLEDQVNRLGKLLSTLGDFRIGEQIEVSPDACLLDVVDCRDNSSVPVDSDTVHAYIEAVGVATESLIGDTPNESVLAEQAKDIANLYDADAPAVERLLGEMVQSGTKLSLTGSTGDVIKLLSPARDKSSREPWTDVDIADISHYVMVTTDHGIYAVDPAQAEKLSVGDVVDIEIAGLTEKRRFIRADRADPVPAKEPDLFD